jgi:hypothetical protein
VAKASAPNDEEKAKVLAWLRVHPRANAFDAARAFWPELEGKALDSRAGAIRTWLSKQRRESTRPDLTVAPLPAQLARPPDPYGDRPDDDLTPIEWHRRQLHNVSWDLVEARRRGRLEFVKSLTDTSAKLRADLRDLESRPPEKAPGEEPISLLSDRQLAELDSDRLCAFVTGLALGHQRQLDAASVAQALKGVAGGDTDE